MIPKSKILGSAGEQLAVNFLKKEGFTILATNWRYGRLEVDIIAREKNYLVFIEVKTRATAIFGEPESFINKRKQAFLITAANAFINSGPDQEESCEVRFDAISIIKSGNDERVNHIRNAFYPSLM